MEEKLEQPTLNGQKEPLQMIIKIQPDGSLSVTFPFLNDLVLALGILENAKIAIIQHSAIQKLKQDTIIKPKFTLGAFGKKRF